MCGGNKIPLTLFGATVEPVLNGNSQKDQILVFKTNSLLIQVKSNAECSKNAPRGAQRLSGRLLDSRLEGHEFEPHRRHCIMSLSKNIYPSLVLVQPRKTRPFITERLFMGRKESNQTKQTNRWEHQGEHSAIHWTFIKAACSVTMNIFRKIFFSF